MSTQEATLQQPLLQAIDLKKHYPVKKGMFAPERLVKALDGVSFNLERGKTLAVVEPAPGRGHQCIDLYAFCRSIRLLFTCG